MLHWFFYDTANAFACGNFDDQDEVLKYRCPENYQILAETYREAVMTMQVEGEWIHVKPSTGIFQGIRLLRTFSTKPSG